MSDLNFIPRILLCGNDSDFFSQIGTRPFKIIGHLKISGNSGKQKFNLKDDGKLFFNDKIHTWEELADFLRSGEVDYLLFLDFQDFAIFRNYSLKRGFLSSKTVTINHFKTLPTDFFYDFVSELALLNYLKNSPVRTLLDVDGYFVRGNIFTKSPNLEIDCIYSKYLPPIIENLYAHIYNDFSEIAHKHYDAALIIERKPIDFLSIYTFLGHFTDNVITFSRTDNELEKYIIANLNNFDKAHSINLETLKWFFLKRHTKPEDFCIYVVTHKSTSLGALPVGYKIIHAGRALSKDLGYLGDDSGDNISYLNPYANEVTALYWIWKNSYHTIIGLCHYRRFFTESTDLTFAYDKILTKDAALKLLERHDIIVSTIGYEMMIQRDLIRNDCGEDLTSFAYSVIKKHLIKNQPDYIDSFEMVMNMVAIYKCNMFVMRWELFDSYCRWLFSFFIDATQEVVRSIRLDDVKGNPRRILGYFSERMMMTWLIKNRLRIKELNFMFIS